MHVCKALEFKRMCKASDNDSIESWMYVAVFLQIKGPFSCAQSVFWQEIMEFPFLSALFPSRSFIQSANATIFGLRSWYNAISNALSMSNLVVTTSDPKCEIRFLMIPFDSKFVSSLIGLSLYWGVVCCIVDQQIWITYVVETFW